MSVAIAVTNRDYTAVDLRRLVSKERDGHVVRRLSALALILEGHSRTVAAEQSGRNRRRGPSLQRGRRCGPGLEEKHRPVAEVGCRPDGTAL